MAMTCEETSLTVEADTIDQHKYNANATSFGFNNRPVYFSTTTQHALDVLCKTGPFNQIWYPLYLALVLQISTESVLTWPLSHYYS
jgi:hypothetical protein